MTDLFKKLLNDHRPEIKDDPEYRDETKLVRCKVCDGDRWHLWMPGDPDVECEVWAKHGSRAGDPPVRKLPEGVRVKFNAAPIPFLETDPVKEDWVDVTDKVTGAYTEGSFITEPVRAVNDTGKPIRVYTPDEVRDLGEQEHEAMKPLTPLVDRPRKHDLTEIVAPKPAPRPAPSSIDFTEWNDLVIVGGTKDQRESVVNSLNHASRNVKPELVNCFDDIRIVHEYDDISVANDERALILVNDDFVNGQEWLTEAVTLEYGRALHESLPTHQQLALEADLERAQVSSAVIGDLWCCHQEDLSGPETKIFQRYFGGVAQATDHVEPEPVAVEPIPDRPRSHDLVTEIEIEIPSTPLGDRPRNHDLQDVEDPSEDDIIRYAETLPPVTDRSRKHDLRLEELSLGDLLSRAGQLDALILISEDAGHRAILERQLAEIETALEAFTGGGAGPKALTLLRKFDPGQKRNPKNGKWIDDGIPNKGSKKAPSGPSAAEKKAFAVGKAKENDYLIDENSEVNSFYFYAYELGYDLDKNKGEDPIDFIWKYHHDPDFKAEVDTNTKEEEDFEKWLEKKEGSAPDVDDVDEDDYLPSEAEEKAYRRIFNVAVKSVDKRKVSAKEKDALAFYQSIKYLALNSYLRNGDSGGLRASTLEEQASQLESVISKSPVIKDIQVWRGVSGSFARELTKRQPGDIFTDKGFVSTSSDRSVAELFSVQNGDNVLVRATLRQGTPALAISTITKNSQFEDQSEILLNRGNAYRIDSISQLETDNGTYTVVDVTHV